MTEMKKLNGTFFKQKDKKTSGGQILVPVILVLLLLTIIVPLLIKWGQNEAHWTVKQARTTIAFQAAEAGIDRGYWKLIESASIYQQLKTSPISEYNLDRIYTDVVGAEYKIQLSTHPSEVNQVVIVGVGRDLSTNEVRKIEAIYERQTLDSAVYAGSGGEIEADGTIDVHWGPIKSQSPVELDGSAATNQFPRKYSTSYIDPWDTSPGGLNTDGLHWWSYYNVPPRPEIDFETIKESATISGTYYSGNLTWNSIDPTGTPIAGDNLFWYIEGDLSIKGSSYVYGTVIVMGDCDIQGGGSGQYTITALPPATAREYAAVDTAAASEWYGDAGGGPPSSLSTNFQFGASGNPDMKDGLKKNVTIRGLLFCGGEMRISGTPVIHGAVIVDGDEVEFEPSGTMMIFYNDEIINNVPLVRAGFIRLSWKELEHSW